MASLFLLADFDGDLSSIAERSDEDNVSDTEVITSEEDEEQVRVHLPRSTKEN